MRETTITIQRPDGTVLTGLDGKPASGILCQVDLASDQETKAALDVRGGSHPFDLFKITTLWWNYNALIRQDDVLIDERYTDPDTNTNFKYRVTGRVKDYDLGHQEVHAWVVPGQ